MILHFQSYLSIPFIILKGLKALGNSKKKKKSMIFLEENPVLLT